MKLWKGTFNWAGEVYEMFTHAINSEKAYLNFCSQLSKKLKIGKRTVMFKFDGSNDNYYIKEIKK